jgi:predicted outer membrane protein
VATINANQRPDRTTRTASEIQGNSDSKAPREYDADTRNFIETHDVTMVTLKATPGSGEEAADLSQAAETGRPHANGDRSSESCAKENTSEGPTHPA